VFLHNVHDGPASQSYGLQVAKLAGVPQDVIRHAKEQLAHLEGNAKPVAPMLNARREPPARAAELVNTAFQGDMFAAAEPSKVEEALSDMELDDLSPREALNRLYELRDLMTGR